MNRFGGTGLGLSICRQLVEQVKGTISVESNIGRGSKFRIEIPVSAVIETDSVNEIRLEKAINILSYGDMQPELLASAQSQDDFTIRHVPCRNVAEIEASLTGIELEKFDVALISQNLARQAGAESSIWTRFSEAEVAPVLISESKAVDVGEVTLRAAFASILPPSPDFTELRSAIRIGCSFARHMRIPADDSSVPPAYKPKRVLVADDNRTNRNVLAAILESVGHHVTMVTDGDEALEILEQGHIDILLLDINMPRLNGIEACSIWRQIEGGRQHLPIIGVTADATSETEQKCHNVGMDLRITKPVDAKLLLSSIARLCKDENSTTADLSSAFDDSDNIVVPITGKSKSHDDAIDSGQIDYLKSIGDQSFLENMVESFFADIEQTLAPLRTAVSTKDLTEFRFCAHALKSSGNNMGAQRLAEFCGRLENVTESDFIEHRNAYLSKIEGELTLAIDCLKSEAGQSVHLPIIAQSR
jgi:two-component system, sensor histidine kinase RpfC